MLDKPISAVFCMFFILWVRKTQINAYARTGYLDASNLSQIATLSILYRDLINKTYQLSLPKILISSTYSQKQYPGEVDYLTYCSF